MTAEAAVVASPKSAERPRLWSWLLEEAARAGANWTARAALGARPERTVAKGESPSAAAEASVEATVAGAVRPRTPRKTAEPDPPTMAGRAATALWPAAAAVVR